jgi:hypothetical protein
LKAVVANLLEPAAYLILLAAATLYAKKRGGPKINLLIAYFSTAFLLLAISSLIVILRLNENIWLYNLHAFATVSFLGLYFRNQFYTPLKKHTVTALMVVLLLYLLVKNLVLREFRLFDSIGYSLVALSLIVYVFMYFHQLLNNVSELNIFDNFNFWLSSSFLIYFSGNFIIFLTYHYFTVKIMATYTDEERDILTNLWGLHNCLLLVGALMLLFGSLWIVYRRKSVLS